MMFKTSLCALLVFGPCFAEELAPPLSVGVVQEVPNVAPSIEETVAFAPPKDWNMADPKDLPENVKAMVVGKGSKEFPPSINLAVESYKGTQKEYLKTVKDINEAAKREWKDLGTIRTKAGDASLSQVDEKSEWGTVRMMHVILVRDGHAYILTAASLKDEFSRFYKDFFAAMRSLSIQKPAPKSDV